VRATVVEIGCGEGHLLRALAERRPDGRYIGFDPNAHMEPEGRFEARAELFEAAVHMAECRPNLVVSRHVLEHLVNPLGFLQSLEFAACCLDAPTWLFIEVPCIDRALATGRTSDFYYEHNSHFTTTSFTRMLQRVAAHVEWIKPSYDGEVICGLARLGSGREAVDFAREAAVFREEAALGLAMAQRQLQELAASGRHVAIWGGTGKAAAFLNRYGVNADRFPIVVDSDPEKVGTYVPGAGQRILSVEFLLDCPAEVILIPMQWRARDVLAEMRQRGITCRQILIEHQGRLIDFQRDPHPY
jgi:SAM-dependent methyltransferase